MAKPIITAENLSKQYTIGVAHHDTLRDAITETIKRPIQLITSRTSRKQKNENQSTPSLRFSNETKQIWALRDVSFSIEQGEAVGIIGRNGAGKTTLLKILSRITEPTSGRAIINGRVGSLLDVGTGFHLELTGRENIYLNGAILSMSRKEIERKFDEIVAFAEIDKFLDTPVKRYSSGMYVRLAFAVAAHLEPEILLVDEVLAVGDISFQKKCLGKMGDVAKEGRTVLFVSHNMGAIQRLCNKTMLLQEGKIAQFGSTQEVVENYIATNVATMELGKWIDVSSIPRRRSDKVCFSKFRIRKRANALQDKITTNDTLITDVVIHSTYEQFPARWAMFIADIFGTKLLNFDSQSLGKEVVFKKGENSFEITIPNLPLKRGTYNIGLWMAQTGGLRLDFVHDVTLLDVLSLKENYIGYRLANDGLFTCDYHIRKT